LFLVQDGTISKAVLRGAVSSFDTRYDSVEPFDINAAGQKVDFIALGPPDVSFHSHCSLIQSLAISSSGRESAFFLAARLHSFLPEAEGGLAENAPLDPGNSNSSAKEEAKMNWETQSE
jgi:hypothetical protein